MIRLGKLGFLVIFILGPFKCYDFLVAPLSVGEAELNNPNYCNECF